MKPKAISVALCRYKTLPKVTTDHKTYSSTEALPSYIQTGVRLARNASRLCDSQYCLGACVIHKNSGQYCVGNCSDRTHPLQKKFAGVQTRKITLHAEIDALTKLRTPDPDIDCMVVVRTLKSSGKYGASKPCDICVGAMINYQVGSVVYFEDGLWHRVYL